MGMGGLPVVDAFSIDTNRDRRIPMGSGIRTRSSSESETRGYVREQVDDRRHGIEGEAKPPSQI